MTLPHSRLTNVIRTLTGLDVSSAATWWVGAAPDDLDDSGPPANRRLTALTGALILPLVAGALLTGLFFGSVWRVHYFVGYLLLPVVLVKIGSTTYRMVRYYLRSGLYRLVRPPYPLGRVTSPLLVVSVLVLFVSGIVMWLTHSQSDPWGWLHTDAAIVFSGIVLLHLGLYLPEALGAARDAVRRTPPPASSTRRNRYAVLGAAVLAGLLLGLITVGQSRLPAKGHRDRRGASVENRAP